MELDLVIQEPLREAGNGAKHVAHGTLGTESLST